MKLNISDYAYVALASLFFVTSVGTAALAVTPGNVQVTKSGHLIKIAGDIGNNGIRCVLDEEKLTITGLNGTVVDGPTELNISGFTRLEIDLYGGNDVLILAPSSHPVLSKLTARTGAGNDTIHVGGNPTTGCGFNPARFQVNSAIILNTGSGDDSIIFHHVFLFPPLAGGFYVWGGGGHDTIFMEPYADLDHDNARVVPMSIRGFEKIRAEECGTLF